MTVRLASSEEHDARTLVELARAAEDAGFSTAAISDHFHPWIDRQGESPFVWAVLGAIAATTDRIEIGTLVTCPTVRMHPAIVAQASATVATMLPGRWFFGVGTGELLNEHVLGDRWPEVGVRREMLEEAVSLIRELWRGDLTSHVGHHFRVESARLYTVPDVAPPIYVAAGGAESAALAGRIGDGLVGTSPDAATVEAFRSAGGAGKRAIAELTVCHSATVEDAMERALEFWPMPGIPGELPAELPLPRHFEQAAETVRPQDLRERVPMGPDPEPFLEAIGAYGRAGFDTVVLHQVGPDQRGFLKFAADELLPPVEA